MKPAWHLQLAKLDAAQSPDDMDLPNWRLHPLKVIPKKEHPIKNLIRRKKTESTKDTKSTNKSKIRSCFSCLSWTILLVDSLLEIT